jgi:hypothetical protein
MKRAGIVVLGVIFFGAVVQSSALAAPADSATYSVQAAWTMAPERSGCSFDIQVAGQEQMTVQATYDKTGSPVRLVAHVDYTGTQTAKGTTLTVSEHAVETADFVAGTTTWTGQQLKISLPKGGPVLLDAGKVVTDLSGNVLVQHGGQTPTSDTARYCAAFGS